MSLGWRYVARILIGVGLGSLVGLIAINDPVYIVTATISITLFFFVIGFTGGRGRPGRIGGRIPGIRNPGDPVFPSVEPVRRPAQAVLNPEPTAVPVTGPTLNGMPVPVESRPLAPRTPGLPGWVRRTITIAVILAAAALTLLPSGRLIAWTVSGIAEGRWNAADPRTGVHQQEMVDDIAALAGSHDFVWIGFYDGYVLAHARTTPGATTTDVFEWRYGRAGRLGPASGTLEGMFDAAGIDFSVVGDVVRFAQEDSGWSGLTYVYPSVRASDGVPEINVSLGTSYYSGSYTFTIAGEYVDRHGTGWD